MFLISASFPEPCTSSRGLSSLPKQGDALQHLGIRRSVDQPDACFLYTYHYRPQLRHPPRHPPSVRAIPSWHERAVRGFKDPLSVTSAIELHASRIFGHRLTCALRTPSQHSTPLSRPVRTTSLSFIKQTWWTSSRDRPLLALGSLLSSIYTHTT